MVQKCSRGTPWFRSNRQSVCTQAYLDIYFGSSEQLFAVAAHACARACSCRCSGGKHIRSAHCCDLLVPVCCATQLPGAMKISCTHWPCAYCTLQIPHTATLDGVQAALRAAQFDFHEHRIDEFQMEMVECAAMHLMQKDEAFAGYDPQDLRKWIIQARQPPPPPLPPFNIFGGSATGTGSAASGSAGDARPPPPPPPPPPPKGSKPEAQTPWSGPSPPVGEEEASKRAQEDTVDSSDVGGSAADQGLSEFKWQIKIGKPGFLRWSDAFPELNSQLEAAYALGHDGTRYLWDGWDYFYEFGSVMMQTNPSGVERAIRRIRHDEDV